MATMLAASGTSVAAGGSTNRLSSSATIVGSPALQQFGVLRSTASSKAPRVVAARASLNVEEQRSARCQVLVALVAAGAALVTTTSPASAGLFDKNVSVERGSSGDFPGNEGTGNKVGSSQGVKGSANSGTPLGEGAGGNTVGDNQAVKDASSSGTPFGEGSKSGSGVNVGSSLNAPDVGGIVDSAKSNVSSNFNPVKSIGDLNPFKGGEASGSEVVSDAKSTAQDVAGDVKSKLPGN